jgi:hypothetical protein
MVVPAFRGLKIAHPVQNLQRFGEASLAVIGEGEIKQTIVAGGAHADCTLKGGNCGPEVVRLA